MADDLPFRAEYAKSGRAACKGCKEKIGQQELRLAVMVQSPMFDGKVPNWHHVSCFFKRNRPKAVGDIGHYDNLRWEDQEKLQKNVEDALAGKFGAAKGGGGKGGKGGKGGGGSKDRGGFSAHGTLMQDFRVEIAKAGGAMCKVCEVKVAKGLPRIGKKDYESDRAKMYGPFDRWHHVQCFAKTREELEFFDAGEDLQGFNTLSKEHKELIRAELKATKRKQAPSTDEPDSKKAKTSDDKDSKADDKQKEELKKQMKKLYYYRDMLERNVPKKELEELLVYNKQEVPEVKSVDKLLDRLADGMMFGALEPCRECENGQFVFQSGVGYRCQGDMSEWTKCQNTSLNPARKEFKLPKSFKESYDFCKLYKSKVKQRIVPNTPSTVRPSPQESNGSSKSLASSFPLKDLSFVFDNKVDKDVLKPKIEYLGGKIGKKVDADTAAVIAKAEFNAKPSKVIKTAKELDIRVVSEDILEGIKEEGVLAQIKKKTISEWGTESVERLTKIIEKAKGSTKSVAPSSSSSTMFTKEMPKSMKLKLKGGAYVDPESGLDHKAHVLKIKDALYSVVLGAVNIQAGMNSYYKLQLLEHDKKSKYYVFRSWGRVGTTIGGTKLEDFGDKGDALNNFKALYQDKTGNHWEHRANFEKVPGKFFPMELDLGQDNAQIQKLEVNTSKSKLAKPIQELITLIFDIESMKKAMVEFEIDLTKMPLGKLSRKQIESAYKILTEVQNLVKSDAGSSSKFLDASNRFFTLIPHDFGMKAPPILDNPDYIKNKVDMLDNLLEIEVAYNLLQSDSGDSKEKDPIDAHYAKLQTKIEVLERASAEFKVLETYVKNTHAATHNMYTLEIEQIFKISRKGEKERFQKYKDLSNRMLLWHGSRTTNFAGILSQGLRIAPPEAPVTGYMFGKGIYFADMVSKSANYCCTSRTNNTGLLMLCDVALGDMYERYQADYIENLPAGKHSTKGVGRTEPSPDAFEELEPGVRVPQGKGVPAKMGADQTSLLYNEYIVYDVAQCNAKYLFRLKFNYKF